jgi:hypothetical protein
MWITRSFFSFSVPICSSHVESCKGINIGIARYCKHIICRSLFDTKVYHAEVSLLTQYWDPFDTFWVTVYFSQLHMLKRIQFAG